MGRSRDEAHHGGGQLQMSAGDDEMSDVEDDDLVVFSCENGDRLITKGG